MIKTLASLLIIFSVGANDYKSFNQPDPSKLPYFEVGDLNPVWEVKEENKKRFLKIEDFNLISNQKENFSSSDFKGKVSVLNFFFATCPGYCPIMTKNIKFAFEDYKENKKVNFVSLSVTPTKDTITVLNSYADKYKINFSNWHLVRGNRDTIYQIAREQLQTDLDVDLKKSEDQFVHSESVYLIDENLFVRGIYNGNKKQSMLKMAQDMKLIMNEEKTKENL
ncbi:MAG: SCO family protein [Halobacteriovoraceae bacterium]|nr:SCO family protein [Halobacteriovoraceae bacterium]|tara:strand:+ start:2844 stop:3512 length:669 start_codon:yes stop_codon:yes gene_type:complete